MTTREEFILSISKKLGRPKPGNVVPPDFSDHPADGLYDKFSRDDIVGQFIHETEALSGRIIRVQSIDKLGKAIESFMNNEKVQSVVVWDDDSERGRAIRAACEDYKKKNDTVRVIVWKDGGNGEELINKTDRADAGIVYAEFGISETGTVVLYNKAGKGRSVSLLPDNIGIVLLEKDIRPRITEVLERMNEPAVDHSCINFISGPSRSADIEMSLSIGVHGPGRVTVFLVRDA